MDIEYAVKLQRWTVLGRATDTDGHIVRGAAGYKRTAAPQEEREERVIRFVSRVRVTVSYGLASSVYVSLRTGRCIGNANWVIAADQLKPLRKLAREAFPKEKKARKTKPADDGGDAVQKAPAQEPVAAPEEKVAS